MTQAEWWQKKVQKQFKDMSVNELKLFLLKMTRMVQGELAQRAVQRALQNKGLQVPPEEA
jgi:hypothetical protein